MTSKIDIEKYIIKKSKSNKYLHILAVWLSNIFLTFNPEIIVFGGGIGTDLIKKQKPKLLEQIKTILKKMSYPCTVNLQFSQMKNAGSLGAAIFAFEKLQKL